MDKANLLSNGVSRAVRLPKNCRFSDGGVFVTLTGNDVILSPNTKEDRWSSLLDSLDLFTDDFLAEEIDPLPLEEREYKKAKH